ncbi:hypothetical protein A5637_16335 [Mycolicibacterium fortuitum]|uniref:hypothetical protein n=1 Tax=Mycolicibacterium fortuitum TaxID=1766 RepID=UPI0007EC3F38|nr:hypothetical protein [Mycolicibacterium fortuitum]OBK02780.1 hypothetical protein A5637_16335 [Mycolicibacterium fortuitum]
MVSDLITLTNTDSRFYQLLGPFLGRREVHRAIGSAVYDDDDKTWIVARDGRKVTGFIAYRSQRGGNVAESCYVARRDGAHEDPTVRDALVRAVIDATAPSPITTMVPKAVAGTYAALGFTELPQKSTKNFVSLVRSAA